MSVIWEKMQELIGEVGENCPIGHDNLLCTAVDWSVQKEDCPFHIKETHSCGYEIAQLIDIIESMKNCGNCGAADFRCEECSFPPYKNWVRND